ncbi:MAG: SMC-Scp complex subunit ScpB [Elusimicrobia bacterium]|nr:SMC-Scp complex subunit ScpB [Elusimicrobiota bacterium]
MEDAELKSALEALLFITDRPLTVKELCSLTQVKDAALVESLVGELKRELEARSSAVQVMEVAQGYQMATRAHFAPFVRRLFTERMTLKLSTASLETLAIVAYKQPLTRAEIEQVRGVEVIAALETLMERGLVQVVGRKETVGRPLEYGTTPDFMRRFGLRDIKDLPALESFSTKPESANALAEGGSDARPPVSSHSDPSQEGTVPQSGTTAPVLDAPAEPVAEPSSGGGDEPRPVIWPDSQDEDTSSR